MNRKSPFDFTCSLARISIWTIVHHNWLAAQIRFYIWCASATMHFALYISCFTISPFFFFAFLCIRCRILKWAFYASSGRC